jgi:hypothetical protein
VQLRFSNVSSKLVFYLEGYDLVKPLGGVEQVQRSLEDVHAEVIRMLGEESARKKMQQLAEEEEGSRGPSRPAALPCRGRGRGARVGEGKGL